MRLCTCAYLRRDRHASMHKCIPISPVTHDLYPSPITYHLSCAVNAGLQARLQNVGLQECGLEGAQRAVLQPLHELLARLGGVQREREARRGGIERSLAPSSRAMLGSACAFARVPWDRRVVWLLHVLCAGSLCRMAHTSPTTHADCTAPPPPPPRYRHRFLKYNPSLPYPTPPRVHSF
jgi:hypothetical protein